MKARHLPLLITLAACLSGCAPGGIGGAWSRIFNPEEQDKTALQAAEPKRESWCYKSLGQIDCYPVPQNLPPESLFSVDPPSKFPTTREAYGKALADSLRPKSAE